MKIDINELLFDKIFRSSITVVLISPNMVDPYTNESDQWIPWEISYSLKEHTRNDRTSQTNAVVAVILPDRGGSYRYFVQENNCYDCSCSIYQKNNTFGLIRENMFNKKTKNEVNCMNNYTQIYTGNPSYITPVKWDSFINNSQNYLSLAEEINENIDEYEIKKID